MPFSGWEIVVVGLALVGLVIALLLLRRVTGSIFGPLFLYELVILARRGQQLRLRVLLAVLLLIGLFLAYLKEFSAYELQRLLTGESVQLPMNRQAAFAETFLVAFMAVQLLAVLLITPALAGSAIAEEKERGSLDYLRTTLLSPWEIGMGKFFARMVFLFAVIATGIPVLGLAMNQGGMDDRVIFAGYVITICSAISVGGVSFYLGTSLSGLREVLLWVYGFLGGLSVFGLCCGCVPGVAIVSPISAMTYTFVGQWTSDPNEWGFWTNTFLFAVIHLLIGLGCGLRAIFLIRLTPPIRRSARKRLRKRRDTYYDDDDDEDDDDEDEEDEEPEPAQKLEQRPRRVIARRHFRVERVPDQGDPFVWKERYFGGSSSAVEKELSTGCGIVLLVAGLFAVGLYLFFVTALELERGQWSGEAVTVPLRTLMTGVIMALGLILGVRLASSIAFERQRQTLDALLMIPVTRAHILWGKFYAAFHLLRFAWLAIALVLVGGLVSLGLHPFGFILGVFNGVGYLLFLATFGLWMSTRCKTVTRATVYVLVLTMVLWFGPLILSPILDIILTLIIQQNTGYNLYFATLSAPAGFWISFFGWSDANQVNQPGSSLLLYNWIMILITSGVYYLLALGSWVAANRRFNREGR